MMSPPQGFLATELATEQILYPSGDITGVADSTNLNNAITALPTTGGQIGLAIGIFNFNSSINMQNKNSITIRGAASAAILSPFPGTTLQWVGANNATIMDCRGTDGCAFYDFTIRTNGPTGMTGMQFDGNPTFNTCQRNVFLNVKIVASGTGSYAIGIQVGVTAGAQVSEFSYFHVQIYGNSTGTMIGVQINSTQALNHNFYGCEIQQCVTAGIRISKGNFGAFGIAFTTNGTDIDLVSLVDDCYIYGFFTEQSNLFLNFTAWAFHGGTLIIGPGRAIVDGAGATAPAITIGNLATGGTVKFDGVTIFTNDGTNGKNIDINASNSSLIIADGVSFVGTATPGTFTGQFPTFGLQMIENGASGLSHYRKIATAGVGLVPVYGSTLQKAESAADTNVLTYTPPATAGSYRLQVVISVSAATAATLGWTATWKDSNGTAQAPTNLDLTKNGVAAPALTFLAAASDTYCGDVPIDIDNSATSIVVKLTFTGTSFTAKVSAFIEQLA